MIGALVAFVGSLMAFTGLTLLKRGADQVSRITWNSGWGVVREFFGCRIWLTGLVCAVSSMAFFALALSLTPVSVVQPIKSSGILLLVVLAVVYLKERLTRVEKAAIALLVVGLVVLGLSLSPQDQATTSVPHARLVIFALGALAVAGLVVAVMVRLRDEMDWGVGLGVVSGALYGIGMLALKGFTALLKADTGFGAVVAVYLLLAILLNVLPFTLQQASFQRGKASTVVATSTAFVALLPVLGGFWVFSERLPASTWRGTARVVGIAAILIGTITLSQFSQAEAGPSTVGTNASGEEGVLAHCGEAAPSPGEAR